MVRVDCVVCIALLLLLLLLLLLRGFVERGVA
jgi:hypothetical protein